MSCNTLFTDGTAGSFFGSLGRRMAAVFSAAGDTVEAGGAVTTVGIAVASVASSMPSLTFRPDKYHKDPSNTNARNATTYIRFPLNFLKDIEVMGLLIDFSGFIDFMDFILCYILYSQINII
jgi:hypothetical protein